MTKPKVSIVCISYNHQKFIKETIEGFILQEVNFTYEIIIADDASTDETQLIISNYARQNPNIKPVLHSRNVGVQINLLDAMSMAKGEYIALCEGDDFWTDPLKLQLQVNFLDNHKDFYVCFHQVEVFFDKDKNKKRLSPQNTLYSHSSNIELKDLLKDNFIPTNSVMYRNIGNYKLNESVMPLDWYLHAYHANLGKIHYIHRMMAKNRRHEGGVWWSSESDPNSTLIQYKDGWVGLFNEFVTLFGSSPIYRPILQVNFSNFIKVLLRNLSGKELQKISIDIINHTGLQSLYAQSLLEKVIEQHHEVQELSRHSDAQGEVIASQIKHIDSLLSELNTIKNTLPWRVKAVMKRLRDKL